MRINSYFLIIFLILSILSCGNKTAQLPVDNRIEDYDTLVSLFQNPPADYRTAPLWVWNAEINKAGIDEQLQQFKRTGIGGVFVHPRPGLITPYLSDEWFRLFQYTVERGKALGMKVWIYDENSYPSGFAGGHVPAQMPESYQQGNGLRPQKLDTLILHPEIDYRVILKKEKNQFIDITEQVEAFKSKPGEYYAFELTHYESGDPWFGGFSYVDLLIPGVTETFLQVTMRDGYEKWSEQAFGKTVPGLFTDEPNLTHGVPGNAIRYTPSLFAEFKKRWGYDLKTELLSLFEPVGEYTQVRHNYYQLLLDLFVERWAKPMYHYCRDNNLQFTGHYWEHGWPSPVHCPDNMAMYAWQQMPGIDMLFNQFTEERLNAQFGNIRSVKEVSSAANQTGRVRKLSETYGGAGWDLTFEDMKRLGDWQYVLGVNFMNQHLSYWTLKGVRKYDWPQSFSCHEPWWPHYKTPADYFARLSVALSAGEQKNKILVIEPTTSVWMHFTPGNNAFWRAARSKRKGKITAIALDFERFLRTCETLQIEYDLGSEDIIADRGRVAGADFVVGERSYEQVVVPPGIENLNRETVELLQQYLEQGGKVVSLSENLKFMDGCETQIFSKLGQQYRCQWRPISKGQIYNVLGGKELVFHQPQDAGGLLKHHRRILDDGELLFLVNSSLSTSSSSTIMTFYRNGYELDLFTGATRTYPSIREAGQNLIRFTLPPAGSLLLFLSDMNLKAENPVEVATWKTVTATSDMIVKRDEDNVLLIDYLDLKFADQQLDNTFFFKAGERLFNYFGLQDGNPWHRAIQYKTDIVDKEPLSAADGFEASYYFSIAENADINAMGDLRCVVEWPQLYDFYINGANVQPLPGEWWLDKGFGVYDIDEHVKLGENRIALKADTMSIHSEMMPVYVLGDFGLHAIDRGWKLVNAPVLQPGAWNQQEHPNYAFSVSYQKRYHLKAGERYRVKLGEWAGTVAEVLVNGKSAALIAWQPCEADISPFVQSGDNDIVVRVYGSLTNLLGPKHGYQKGIASPWSIRYAPDGRPAGTDYHSNAYGLFEDFETVRGEKSYDFSYDGHK
ncbi:hypothetical protein GF407_13080 [candidate division KSB1 bacterium]|nr:hypothetical protein [candidate division KSB1 bacterium]